MHILRLHCDDRPGIVAAVATSLNNADCNIEDSAQFHDPFSGQFFMRVVFSTVHDNSKENFTQNFGNIAQKFNISWGVYAVHDPLKTLLLVSKDDHCLSDLLYRWRTAKLPIEIAGVISNHENNRALAEERGLDFHYLPITDKTKNDQEQQITEIIQKTNSELVVLARYMQILSGDFCERFMGKIINIHHSFLPGFKGAKPYHQAYERGVKIIGATAHFATQDLDEGPIIEQETIRIDHAHDPKKLQILGQDIECKVLARAISLYTERRIFLHGARTIIL